MGLEDLYLGTEFRATATRTYVQFACLQVLGTTIFPKWARIIQDFC